MAQDPSFTFDVPDLILSDGTALRENGTDLQVRRFTGEEGISRLFRFDIELVFHTTEEGGAYPFIDPSDVIGQKAGLILEYDETTQRTVWGVITDLQMGNIFDGSGGYDHDIHYRATLQPRLHRLSLNHQSRVFQHLPAVSAEGGILKEVLEKAGLGSFNDLVEVDLNAEVLPPRREYCVQYQETDLNFINRLLEAEGIFYYFENESEGEKMVVTDHMSRPPDAGENEIPYSPSTALVTGTNSVFDFSCRHQVTTDRVRLREVNYEDSGLGQSDYPTPDPSTNGAPGQAAPPTQRFEQGQAYLSGRDYAITESNKCEDKEEDRVSTDSSFKDGTSEYLDHLAKVRQEEIACRRRIGTGRSDCMDFFSGLRFELANHVATRSGDDKDAPPAKLGPGFLLTHLKHVGGADEHGQRHYYNEFTCVPTQFADGDTSVAVAYRPPRRTPVPRMSGIMTAEVEQKGQQKDEVDIDQEGRYAVRMPFDQRSWKERDLGTASKRIRMAQPYTGKDYGIHFPNHAGTELVFACIDGDVDRPVALGTVPNWHHHSIVPNTARKMGSQNSVDGLGPAAASLEGPFDYEAADEVTFDAKKNVIRTTRGHQLVMDDGDGTGNVGITLGVGKSKMGMTDTDPYWHSSIAMGGYRKKTAIEQGLDSVSEIVTYLSTLGKVKFPELTEIIAGIIASEVSTGDYMADTFGSTTPVGLSGSTDQVVAFTGANGVKLSMPNFLGAWGAGVIPGLGTGQHRVAGALVKFVMNLLYKDLLKDWTGKIEDLEERTEGKTVPGFPEFDKDGMNAFKSWLEYEKDKKLSYTSGLLMSALGMPAINLESVAGINLAAFGKTSIMGGYDGIQLDSKANLQQGADLDVNVEAGQGIVIKAGGEPVGSPGFLGLWPQVANNVPLLKQIPPPFGKTPKPSPDHCHITILNEKQDVRTFAFEGNIEQRAQRNVMLCSTEGSIHGTAAKGNVAFDAQGSSLDLIKDAGAHIRSEGRIALEAGDGKASIVLHPDGKIEISGTDVVVNGGNSALVKGGKKLELHGKTALLAASAPAAGPAPKQPEAPDEVAVPVPPFEQPPVTASPDASPQEAKRIAALNKQIQKNNALGKEIHQRQKQEYDQYLKQLENYHKKLAKRAAKTGGKTATITLSPSGIASDTKGNVSLKCTNFKTQAKVNQQHQGTLVAMKAKGILQAKGALSKIG